MARARRPPKFLTADPEEVAAGPYAESEEQFKRLGVRKYADWVAGNFPWKLWSGPWADFGGWNFVLVASIRAKGDPSRISRMARRERGEGHTTQWDKSRHVPVEEYEKTILAATADGRPRTLNRLALESIGMTADIIPRAMNLALYNLVYRGQLVHAWLPDENVMLFWNDDKWRRAHPEYPRESDKIGQLQLEVEPHTLPIAGK